MDAGDRGAKAGQVSQLGLVEAIGQVLLLAPSAETSILPRCGVVFAIIPVCWAGSLGQRDWPGLLLETGCYAAVSIRKTDVRLIPICRAISEGRTPAALS